MKFAYLIEPPFNYTDQSGNVVGHDVEIAQHVLHELGEGFEPVETEFAQLLPGLQTGDWQMTTGLFATEERQRLAAFTRPIWALPDGLLVRRGNPCALNGYGSIAEHETATLAVIRDQFQHRSAISFGVPDARLQVFETYLDAAQAVRDGHVDAYASVGRAHTGFIEQNASWELQAIDVPHAEKPPAFGAFGIAKSNLALLSRVNEVLTAYLGSPDHLCMARRYGFSEKEVQFVAGAD